MATPRPPSPSSGEAPPPIPPEDHLEVLDKQLSNSSYFPLSTDTRRDEVERSRRLDDHITELRAERIASRISQDQGRDIPEFSLGGSRSRYATYPADDFDIASKLPTEKSNFYQQPEPTPTRLARAAKRIHSSSWLVRYFFYITPIGSVLVIPVIFGAFITPYSLVGGVYLMWFAIWLEIIWLSLWAARIVAHMMPSPLGIFMSFFSNASKKWRDMGKQLEIAMTLFLWGLAVEVSFLPIMHAHTVPNYQGDTTWMGTVNIVIVSIFVGLVLNLVEKVIIQLTAISFHNRTYQDRIQTNETTINVLVALYTYSKNHISQSDWDFEDRPVSGPGSGARTPAQVVEQAQRDVAQAMRKVGDAAGKVAEDFTGRKAQKSTHPNQVILVLLNTEKGCKVLARRLFRTFEHKSAEPDSPTHEKHSNAGDPPETAIYPDDLRPAFEVPGEDPEHVTEVSNEAFAIFDRDLNGDITPQELELAILEAASERKSIIASLKDLDSVVSKLDQILVWLVVIITILVFVSLISKSAQSVLTSAGSTLLALSWLFSTSAQEFLGSLIFVFIKHPFDVGDRVTIYGSSGTQLKGDDYYVKEVSLLYTEFKKLQGQVVQAPNSYLNTLFILNMRRSGGLSESITLSVKFGTTLEQIDALREGLLEFVKGEPREYQGNILTEVRDIVDCWSVDVNVSFFYKTNWQNELLRLRRRNKFICVVMHLINELGIDGPQSRMPGYAAGNPLHVNYGTEAPVPPVRQFVATAGDGGNPNLAQHLEATGVTPARQPSIIRQRSSHGRSLRSRGESVSSLSKRVDFSLGMQDVSSDVIGDVHEESTQSRTRNANASRNRIATIEEGDEPSPPNPSRERAPSIARTRTHSMSAGGRSRSHTNTNSMSDYASTVQRNRFLGLRLTRPRGDSSTGGEEGRMERGSAGPGSMSGRISPTATASPRMVRPSRSNSIWSRPSNRQSLDH